MTIDINLLAAIASISGYSFRDIISFTKSPNKAKFLLSTVSRLLAVLDDEDDQLTGIWTLEKADYEYEKHSRRYVTGNLAVLYSNKSQNDWYARAILEYRKNHSYFLFLSANGTLAHRFGACVTGIYDIKFSKKSSGELGGQSTMIYANPERHIKDQAIIRSIKNKDDRLKAVIENTNTKGIGHYSFFMRKRWSDLVKDLSN